MQETSFEGFYKKTPAERLEILAKKAQLSEEEKKLLQKTGALEIDSANRMIENVVGVHPLPLGLATNFLVNGREFVVPFAVEEPSVVAAASNAAKLAREKGGFTASADEPIMIGQLQLLGVKDVEKAKKNLMQKKKELIGELNRLDPSSIVKFGGGLKDIEFYSHDSSRGKMVVLHLLVDCRDSMGANSVNTILEALTPEIEKLTGGQARLRIISNLAIHRKARAKATWSKKSLGESTKAKFSGEEVVERILDAYEFAVVNQFRCATHNKGIMNGIDAVVIACGNDWRAVEAGAHAYAAYGTKYRPLTKYYKNSGGDLVGEIELPMAVGTIGGAVRSHPLAAIALKILGVKSAQELSQVIAAVGLAQNFAALRALSTEGISLGHMKLHGRNIAVMAGASGGEIDLVAQKIAGDGKVNLEHAKKVLDEIRAKKKK